jgi:hypothetical protein
MAAQLEVQQADVAKLDVDAIAGAAVLAAHGDAAEQAFGAALRDTA